LFFVALLDKKLMFPFPFLEFSTSIVAFFEGNANESARKFVLLKEEEAVRLEDLKSCGRRTVSL